MDLGEAERVEIGGRDIQSPDSPNQPQIRFPPTEQRQRHSGDPQHHPETPRDPGASHTHPEELSRPPGTGRDAAAGWGTEAAMANPSSLSQAAINIPAFPKRGRRFGSSAPDQRQTEGKNRINRGVCPKTATAPAGGRQSWVGRGCGKRVHPQIGASSHQGQTNIPVPERPAARTALTARGGRAQPGAGPRSPGAPARGVPGHRPRSPGAPAAESRARPSPAGVGRPGRRAPAPPRRPTGRVPSSAPRPPHRMGPKAAAAGRRFLPAAGRSRARGRRHPRDGALTPLNSGPRAACHAAPGERGCRGAGCDSSGVAEGGAVPGPDPRTGSPGLHRTDGRTEHGGGGLFFLAPFP